MHHKRIEQIQESHKQSITANRIIISGWSNGLDVDQTLMDLQRQGFLPSREAVLQMWVSMDELMNKNLC